MGSRVEPPLHALSAWDRFWFAEIPPHIYALLRILFGLLALASLIGVRHFSEFWDLDGFVPSTELGLKAQLLALGLGRIGGRVLFFGSLASYAMMIVGYRSGVTVPFSLGASVLQPFWNRLPLSAAHMALQTALFCLCWADCGSVWSVDAYLAGRRTLDRNATGVRHPIAPLRLLRFQVALVYLNSGVWKLFNERWRVGSAVHYVLNNTAYRRFPFEVPPSVDWVTSLLTYSVLFWELTFAVMILIRPLRRLALAGGIVMHLGMAAGIEIGPFPWVMIATYASFLDPERVPFLPQRLRSKFGRPGPVTA
jgi:uncharacterized membrane protein YphA (DoxX/SURF4 family)